MNVSTTPFTIKTLHLEKKFPICYERRLLFRSSSQHHQELFSIGEKATRRENLVNKSQVPCLIGLDCLTGQHQSEGGIVSNQRGEIDSSNRRKDSKLHFWQSKGRLFVGNHSITERHQFAATTKRISLDQRHRRNLPCSQFLKCSTIIINGTQHLALATIQVVMDIDTGTEGSFPRACENNQVRRMLDRIAHSRRQLVKHLNRQDIERGPIKDQPEDILMETNTHIRHTSIFNRLEIKPDRFSNVYKSFLKCITLTDTARQ